MDTEAPQMQPKSRINVRTDGKCHDYLDDVRLKFSQLHPIRSNHEEILQRVLLRWSKFISSESVEKASMMNVSESDVFIATHSKAGTTLTQQIVHQLRSKGSMDFEEIGCVVPWIEMAYDLNQNVNDPQPFCFRAFKTHCSFEDMPKEFLKNCEKHESRADKDICPSFHKYFGDSFAFPEPTNISLPGKSIYILRDPYDLYISFYDFMLNWFFTEEEVRLCDFIEIMLYRREVPYMCHICHWLAAASKYPNSILVLFYEDIVADKSLAVQEIMKFLNIDSVADAAERLQVSILHSDFLFMKQNDSKFDEHISQAMRNKIFGAVGDGSSKLGKTGRAGKGKDALGSLIEEINEVLFIQFNKHFKDIICSDSKNIYLDLKRFVYNLQGINVFRSKLFH